MFRLSGSVQDGSSYSLGFRFGNYTILAMDNRTERTPTQIISDANWKNTLVPWLNNRPQGKSDHLFLLSAVPVVYRRFDLTSDVLKAIPGHQEPEDDLIDHWSHKWHEGERSKLVQHLFRIVEEKGFRTACILSGDVHVGALGVLHHKKTGRKIPQIISSAIVNREPSWLQWVGLIAASTDDDFDIPATDVRVTMEKPIQSDSKYIRARNFVRLCEGTDGKVWSTWFVEGQKVCPEYPAAPLPA